MEGRESFASALMAKLAAVKQIEATTGINTTALQKETERQIKQVMPDSGGDPISGKVVTKSGDED